MNNFLIAATACCCLNTLSSKRL